MYMKRFRGDPLEFAIWLGKRKQGVNLTPHQLHYWQYLTLDHVCTDRPIIQRQVILQNHGASCKYREVSS